MKSTTAIVLEAIAQERFLLAQLDKAARLEQRENSRLSYAAAYALALSKYPNVYDAALHAGTRARRGKI